MAITNRALDVSQQKDCIQMSVGPLGTGASKMVCTIPSNCLAKMLQVSAAGLSGSPVLSFAVERFIVGSGATIISAGPFSTLALTAVGTSGQQSVSMVASGSSLLSLLSGDLIHVSESGSNANALEVMIALVVQEVQDVKAMFGSAV